MHFSLAAILDCANQFGDEPIKDDLKSKLKEKIRLHQELLHLEYQIKLLSQGWPRNKATSLEWFSEKVGGAASFANIAIDDEAREGYTLEKARDNVRHYAYLVGSALESW